jgi:hypothetical protein
MMTARRCRDVRRTACPEALRSCVRRTYASDCVARREPGPDVKFGFITIERSLVSTESGGHVGAGGSAHPSCAIWDTRLASATSIQRSIVVCRIALSQPPPRRSAGSR